MCKKEWILIFSVNKSTLMKKKERERKFYVFTVRQFFERSLEAIKKTTYFWKFDKLSVFFFLVDDLLKSSLQSILNRQMERLPHFIKNENLLSFKLLPYLRNLMLKIYRFFYPLNIFCILSILLNPFWHIILRFYDE